MQTSPQLDPATDEVLAKRYYEGGFWHRKSLWSTLSLAASRRPKATAFIDGARSLSYGALQQEAGRFAGALQALGVQAGEPVLIHGRNCIESAIAMLGCWRQGFVAVPLPPMFSSAQLASILANSGARILLCTAEGDALEQAVKAAASKPLLRMVTLAQREGALSWADLLASCDAAPEPAPAAPDVLALLIYSSGTTGAPKGVMHSSNTIRYTAEQIAALHDIDASDVILVACQFGFVGSIVFGYLVTLVTGATAVLVGRWNPEQTLGLIERHRVSYSLLMPTHIIDLLASKQLARTDCSSFRRGVLAGITREQRAHAASTLCALPLPMFGMSECAGQTTCRIGDAPDKLALTDGQPLPGADILILDEAGAPVAAGVHGHVLVRGPSRCLGYFGAPEASREAITASGHFRTGDLGVLDDEGFFTFGTRARDVLRRGGVTIVPAEIEDRLRQSPQVHDAAVIGVPDDRLGERICACVIAKGADRPTLESLNAAFEAMGLAQYLRPEILLVFDEFPRTPSFKVKKVELRELALRRLEESKNVPGISKIEG